MAVTLSKSPANIVDRSIVIGTARVEKKPENAFLTSWIQSNIAANNMLGVQIAARFWGLKK